MHCASSPLTASPSPLCSEDRSCDMHSKSALKNRHRERRQTHGPTSTNVVALNLPAKFCSNMLRQNLDIARESSGEQMNKVMSQADSNSASANGKLPKVCMFHCLTDSLI